MTSKSVASRVVDAILEDLTDRRGLKHEWSKIDADVRAEIKKTWTGIVSKFLPPPSAAAVPPPQSAAAPFSGSLEESVATFIADVEEQLDRQEKDTGHRSHYNLSNIAGPLRKLRAAYQASTGTAPSVPRNPYERKVRTGAGRENEIEETHESYGLIQINRTQSSGARLFGSSVRHGNYFRLSIFHGKRVMTPFGEHFWEDGRVPIVDVYLSPAQFVEMITAQNIGSGSPCTLSSIGGVPMDPVPDGAGSEIKLTVEMFRERLDETIAKLRTHDRDLHKILEKKTFTKDDKKSIADIVHAARRLMDDSAPYAMKMMGEHTEKLVAKGKMELDSFIQLAINRAGIKAIRDGGGTLILGEGLVPSASEKTEAPCEHAFMGRPRMCAKCGARDGEER